MRIMKSGAEMTTDELMKSRAGFTCACACIPGPDSETMFNSSDMGGGCACSCAASGDPNRKTYQQAYDDGVRYSGAPPDEIG